MIIRISSLPRFNQVAHDISVLGAWMDPERSQHYLICAPQYGDYALATPIAIGFGSTPRRSVDRFLQWTEVGIYYG